MKIRRRPLTLLEVLIAFSLVLLCIFPLIYPLTGIYKAEKEFIRDIEKDRAANMAYAIVMDKLLRNEITFEQLQGQEVFEIPGGTFSFERSKPKEMKDWKGKGIYNLDIKLGNKTYPFKVVVVKPIDET